MTGPHPEPGPGPEPGSGLVVGIGARRGVTAGAVRALLDRVAAEHGLDLAGAVVATLETKLDEPGLRDAVTGSTLLGLPAEVLAGVTVPHPNDRAERAVGTPSVAEAAALHAAGRSAGDGAVVTLVVPKTAGDGVTVAVASYRRHRRNGP
ncbi:cobalt-precorrin 5A hydrolase [Pseudonocardia sediminis]|uniref:Cobalt-precorrin 5A hydrolase n=1 Tax=Pseudonocardia sediminis TaxID=1397368 RepID=A0A4Q7UVU4_PSEST|nr:cobalamin biosynthesis protein [Pseudonocardia sediminis]RZT85088.1 cobalt-precorrin 5A hydrolase [Pseudonocardia sediminis]